MLTYRQMDVLMQHLRNGVQKASDQVDLDITYDLVSRGLLQQLGAVKMWVLTKEGSDMTLRNLFGWKLTTALSSLLNLSTEKRDWLFYALCKF